MNSIGKKDDQDILAPICWGKRSKNIRFGGLGVFQHSDGIQGLLRDGPSPPFVYHHERRLS